MSTYITFLRQINEVGNSVTRVSHYSQLSDLGVGVGVGLRGG